MTVRELNRDQLDELKWAYYYSDDYDPRIVGNNGLPILFAGDIPDRIIFEVYAGITFVEDDFSTRTICGATDCEGCIIKYANDVELCKKQKKEESKCN